MPALGLLGGQWARAGLYEELETLRTIKERALVGGNLKTFC